MDGLNRTFEGAAKPLPEANVRHGIRVLQLHSAARFLAHCLTPEMGPLLFDHRATLPTADPWTMEVAVQGLLHAMVKNMLRCIQYETSAEGAWYKACLKLDEAYEPSSPDLSTILGPYADLGSFNEKGLAVLQKSADDNQTVSQTLTALWLTFISVVRSDASFAARRGYREASDGWFDLDPPLQEQLLAHFRLDDARFRVDLQRKVFFRKTMQDDGKWTPLHQPIYSRHTCVDFLGCLLLAHERCRRYIERAVGGQLPSDVATSLHTVGQLRENECPVCYRELAIPSTSASGPADPNADAGDAVRAVATPCNHALCSTCYDTMVEKHSRWPKATVRCPICRGVMLETAARIEKRKFAPIANTVTSAEREGRYSALVSSMEQYIRWLPEKCIIDAQFSALDTGFENFRLRMVGNIEDAVNAICELRRGSMARFNRSLYPNSRSLHHGIHVVEYQANLALIMAMEERLKA